MGLTKLPFWASLVMAAFFYLGLTYLPPLFAGSSMTGAVLAKVVPAFAPWLAGAAVAAGLAGIGRRWFRRFLFSRATGIQPIREMAWADLELLVGEAYRRRGYAVTERGGSQPDGGIDLELVRDGERSLVQCKQWKQPVGVERVRELLGVVTGEGAARGVLVAPGGFTPAAWDFAKGKTLELIDGERLVALTAGSKAPPPVPTAPLAKTPFCPTCGKPMVRRTAQKGPTPGFQFWGCSTFAQTGCRGKRAA